MTLFEICMEIAAVENGLAYGEIDFTYDSLMSAMKPGHPADILDDIFTEIGTELFYNRDAEIPMVKVEAMYKNLNDFKRTFKIRQLAKPLKDLKAYIDENKA